MSSEHYSIWERFSWIPAEENNYEKIYTESDAQDLQKTCSIMKTVVHTSEIENAFYSYRVYKLATPSLLEWGHIQEEVLWYDDKLVIHDAGVIRDWVYLDKSHEVTVRVFDDENTSRVGTINKQKKINIVFHDLHVWDIQVYAVTIIKKNNPKNILEKEFFYYNFWLPTNDWCYKIYSFHIINGRKKSLVIRHNYFRDENWHIIKHEDQILSQWNDFIFSINDAKAQENNKFFCPNIQCATQSSWENIWHKIYETHELLLSEKIRVPQKLQDIWDKNKNLEHNIVATIEYVQNHISYIYDGYIMESHTPQSVEKTLAGKSGDCKAKSLLLLLLLQELWIKSEMILVNYQGNFFLQTNIPSPFHFNHAIVKVYFQDSEYFIDPTQKNRYGSLDNRAEPFFTYYLPIRELNSGLQERVVNVRDVSFHEVYEIDIKKKSFRMKSTDYARIADTTRYQFLDNENKKILTQQEQIFISHLCIQEKIKYTSDIFTGSSIRVVEDLHYDNIFQTKYSGTFLNIYSNRKNILKFYPNDFQEIQYQRIDGEYLYNQTWFTRKIEILWDATIVKKWNPTSTKEIKIDNEFFFFKNSKIFKRKSVIVETEYRVKYNWYIPGEKLQKFIKDYNKICDSNNWIGVVFDKKEEFSFWTFFWGCIFVTWVILKVSQFISG